MPRTGWLACGAIAGALVAAQAAVSVPWLLVLLAASALACGIVLLSGSGRRAPALLAIGAALVLARAAMSLPANVPDEAVDPAAQQLHRARVVTTYAPSGGMQRAVLELEAAGPAAAGASGAAGRGPRAYASLPRYPPIGPGDLVDLGGRLDRAPAADESGFAEFLAREGIGYTIRARSLELVATDDTPQAELDGIRRGAAEGLARTLPEPQAGLAAAIVIGLRDRVDRDVAADFRTAGLSHVVAISGFHIALVAALASALLRPLSRRPRSVALALLLVGYALLAGASPSVLRATAMAGTVLVLRISGRRGEATAALGCAILLLLLIEPATVTEVGFQLSVAATAGLLRWASPFADWLQSRISPKVPGWLVETLAVSLAAQLATLPLVLAHFGRLSLVAPLSNLLAAPLIAPAMGGAGISLGLSGLVDAGVPPMLGAPVQLAASSAIGALIGVAELTASLPLASIELAPPFDALGAAGAALLVLLALRRRSGGTTATPNGVATRAAGLAPAGAHGAGRRHRLLAPTVGLVAVVALLGGLMFGARPDGRLHMTVLDVGQGDAILLVGPGGTRALIDTGPDPDRLIALLDARLPSWDRRLDLVVITHPHEDHVAGLALLLDRYQIGQIAEPGMIGAGPGDAAFRQRLARRGRSTRILSAGDSFALDGARVSVRWPLPGRVPERPSDGGKAVNNVSIVLDIELGQRRLLLTGDIEEEIDAQLLAGMGDRDGPSRPIDVLKVAHHGSRTATTDAFIERTRPSVAVISAGLGNSYGHPSPLTLARLEVAGARVLRTDLDGSVHVSTDGHDLVVAKSGGRARAVIEAPSPPGEIGLGFCPIPPASPPAQPAAYNRGDGGALAPGRGAHASRSRAARLAAAPLGRRSRDRRLPRCRRERERAGAGRVIGGRSGPAP